MSTKNKNSSAHLIRYWDVFKTSIKNNFVREFIYRSNILAMTLADLIWIFIEIAFFEVIYSNITAINSWTKEQTFFFLGVFVSADALFMTFFQRNFWQFPALVNQGELDIFLTKPINAVFLATTRYVNFTQLFSLVVGVYLIHKYGPPAGFMGGWHWLLIPLWIIVGTLAQFLIRFTFVMCSFWIERGIAVSRLYYQFYSLANKPDLIYPKLFRYLIKTILPFAFIGSVPSQALLGMAKAVDYGLMVLSLGAYCVICVFMWKRGLKRYQSASS